MSLRKYEAFAKTIELRSLTKAADELGYTQSGISHILNSLESETGFPLLRRNRGGVSLTAEGEILYPKILEILKVKQEIDQLTEKLSSPTAGIVRVGTFTSVAVNWLPGILKEFNQSFPNVEVRLFNGDYHDIEQWLLNGEIDVGFLALPAPPAVTYVSLMEDPLYVILPSDHPLTAYDTVPVELAAKEPIISLLETSMQDTFRALGSSGLKPDIRYPTKDDYAIIAMVQAGLGISIMPKLLLTRNQTDVAIRPLDPAAHRTIALGYKPNTTSGSAIENFIQLVVSWVNRTQA